MKYHKTNAVHNLIYFIHFGYVTSPDGPNFGVGWPHVDPPQSVENTNPMLKMKIAIQSGRTEQAKAHWRSSLRRDPLPLRAPLKVNEMILEIAAEYGAASVDLYERFGPFPSGVLFTDTLHFSQAGIEQVAATLIPEIDQALKSQ